MKILTLSLCVFLFSGCATKRYGRQLQLTDAERTYLTCEQLDLEIAKTRGFMEEIDREEFDGRDALGILGDFGIGNAMERGDALNSAKKRMAQLEEQKRVLGCPGALPPPPPEVKIDRQLD